MIDTSIEKDAGVFCVISKQIDTLIFPCSMPVTELPCVHIVIVMGLEILKQKATSKNTWRDKYNESLIVLGFNPDIEAYQISWTFFKIFQDT